MGVRWETNSLWPRCVEPHPLCVWVILGKPSSDLHSHSAEAPVHVKPPRCGYPSVPLEGAIRGAHSARAPVHVKPLRCDYPSVSSRERSVAPPTKVEGPLVAKSTEVVFTRLDAQEAALVLAFAGGRKDLSMQLVEATLFVPTPLHVVHGPGEVATCHLTLAQSMFLNQQDQADIVWHEGVGGEVGWVGEWVVWCGVEWVETLNAALAGDNVRCRYLCTCSLTRN